MWQMATMAVCHSFLLLFGFPWPTAVDAAMLAVGGVANAAAQYAWTRALLLAPASAVSPFYYLMLVWAMAIGFVIWGDMPTLALAMGSAIVVASGMFLLWHEATAPLTDSLVGGGGEEASVCGDHAAIEASFVHCAISAGTCSIGTAGENR